MEMMADNHMVLTMSIEHLLPLLMSMQIEALKNNLAHHGGAFLAKLFASCMLISWPNVTIGCRASEIGLSKLMNYSRQIYI
jgi:hypothetical protein